jgi:DNA-binding MarR family transcriptional regulator
VKSETRDKNGTLIDDITSAWKRERPDLDLSDFLLCIYLMRLGRRIDSAYDLICRTEFGISGPDMRVLFALRRSGSPYARRPTDLYMSTLVTSGAITKQVDRLQELGFVERKANSSDQKSVMIQLTRRGLRAADKATEILARQSVISTATRRFSAKDRIAAERIVRLLLGECERVLSRQEPPFKSGPNRKNPRKPRKTATSG